MVNRIPHFRRFLFFILALIGPLAGSVDAQRQAGPGGATGTLIVQVRAVNNTPLQGFAQVRLYDPVGSIEMRATTQDGGRATFRDVPVGDYRVEVTSAGFENVEEEVSMYLPDRPTYAFINLRPEGSAGAAVAAGPPLLAPKAQKELERAQALLKADKPKEAIEHLERAYKLAPGYPDICYLLGVAHLRLNQHAESKTYLEKTLGLDPKHLGALNSLGALHVIQAEDSQALQVLSRSAEIAPNWWKTHWMIATVHARLRDFPKALESVEKAVELSAGAEPAMLVMRAQLLESVGRHPDAIAQLESFLAAHPKRPEASNARQRLEKLKARASQPQVEPAATVSAPAAVPKTAYVEEVRTWAPPDVDQVTAAVEPGVACSLPDVLKATGRRAVAMVESLQSFTATETITRRMFDAKLDTETQWVFDYQALIEQPRPGILAVSDYRTVKGQAAPYDRQTRVTAMALIFHPFYVSDFEVRCEGRGEVAGQLAWVVYFRQRPDSRPRVRVHRTGGRAYPVKLKGRAWISVNSSQIIRLQTDAMETIPELRLTREHLTIDYAPVQFEKRRQRVWLPSTAEFYVDFDGKRYRDQYKYSEFKLFSVDSTQKITLPKAAEEPPK